MCQLSRISVRTKLDFSQLAVIKVLSMDKVINCFLKKPDAVARLICFPWAGGPSIPYARWGNILSSVEVYAVRLPGRESRINEPLHQSMHQVVEEVLRVLLPVIQEKPFALFGHSFGAMACFAFAEKLKRSHGIEPIHIFLSGTSAPYSETRLKAPSRSGMSDEEFLQWMKTIGGTPPELLANPEVMRLFLPPLKADLHVVESYRCSRPEAPFLSCPVTCFDGKDDLLHDLQAWKEMTSGDFSIQMFPGAHFYLREPSNEKRLLDWITKHLETAEMDYL